MDNKAEDFLKRKLEETKQAEKRKEIFSNILATATIVKSTPGAMIIMRNEVEILEKEGGLHTIPENISKNGFKVSNKETLETELHRMMAECYLYLEILMEK